MKMILSTIIPKIGYEDLDKQLSKDKCDFAPCQISMMGTAKTVNIYNPLKSFVIDIWQGLK